MSNLAEIKDNQEDWQFLPIKDFAHTTSGGTPKRGVAEYYNGDVPWVKSGDLNDSHLNKVDEYITELGLDKSSAKLFKPGTLLIALYGATIGRLSILNIEASTNQAVCGITVPKDVDVKYLFYYLLSIRQKLIDQGKGGAQPNINQQIVKETVVPLAPPEQQKRIVAKIEELFSHIDAGIAALKKAKQLLKQYRQSVLKTAVTGELTKEWREANKAKLEPASELLERILKERREKWEEQQLEQFKAKGKMPKDDKWKGKYKEPIAYDGTPLFELPDEWCWVYMGQLGDVIGGLTKNKKREQLKQQLPYLRVANVYANELRLDDVTQIGVKENELERVLLEKGDLLIVEGNGSPEQIGRLAIWDGSIEPCVHQNHLIKIRLQEKDSGNYLMYWLSSLGGRDAILQVASSTSGLYTLSISKVSGLPVPMPPIEEQVEIHNLVSSKLSSIEHLEAEIDIQLMKTEKNKQSILASAFSGVLLQ